MAIELSTSNRMEFDEVCFQRSETQDYNLEDLVHPPDPSSKHLIDYRVKLLLKNDIILGPGQEVLAQTACMIEDGISDFCIHVTFQQMCHTFQSCQFT